MSEPVYTEKEIEEIDPKPFTYEGRTYTAYQAQQQMRKMERAMRKQKDRCITADAAGDKDGFTIASVRLNRQKYIYIYMKISAKSLERTQSMSGLSFLGSTEALRQGQAYRQSIKNTG